MCFWLQDAKRSLTWSNSPGVGCLSTPKLHVKKFKELREKEEVEAPVIKYVNKAGKAAWKGTRALTDTGTFSCI